MRRLAAALATVGAALASTAVAVAAPPTPFYVPPSPLPAGAPGDVLRVERAPVPALPGARAYRVLYRSTSALGEPNAVSGLIIVPPNRRPGAPVVGMAPGFQGMSDTCAPSLNSAGGGVDPPLMLALLARGYVLAQTDYEGMGTPGDHRYVIGASAAHAVLDVLRAARKLPAARVAASAPMGVTGYSQGGHAAMFTAELQPVYAPDVPLVGVAAGGLPADFNAIADFMDGGWFSPLLMATALSYDATYSELRLDDYLNARGVRLREQLRTQCFADILTGPAAFTRSSRYLKTDPLKSAAWQARLAENFAGTRRPPMPLLLYHGRPDEGVPFPQALAVRDRYCALGANVNWREYVFTEHALTSYAAYPRVVRWLDGRFRGQPAVGNCAAR